MPELVPPKPTKEFHEAYLEIYGKSKKKEEKELEELDLPPLKVIPVREEKKGFLTNLFKKEQPTMPVSPAKEEKPSLPEIKLPEIKLPEIKLPKRENQEKPLFDLSELEKLDMPPAKEIRSKKEILPELQKWDIEMPLTAKEEIPKKKTGKIYDFLAEIKTGAKKKEEIKKEFEMPKIELPQLKLPKIELPKSMLAEQAKEARKIPSFVPKKAPEKYPVFEERKESIFEREKLREGARDVQFAYEKKHKAETGGFEYLEKIKPLQKPEPLAVETAEEMPKIKISEFKSKEDFKKHMKLLKMYEAKVKKEETAEKRKMQELSAWKEKIAVQEKRIDEKMRKIEQMEKELQQKQDDVSQYEPKMRELYQKEDAIAEKERELQQRQEDIHATERQLKEEETSIVAKVKKLEADQKLLEKEQNSIVKTVAKMEMEKEKIAEKNREFSAILRKIEEEEQTLKLKADVIESREQRLIKKEKILQKDVERVERLKKKAERLKDVEETYERMKRRLQDAYREYEEKFSQKAYAAPREIGIRPVAIEPTIRPLQKQEEVVISGDMTNLLTITKQLIMEKHYEEANKNINKLMIRYMQIPENNPRKKEIYYEILGLKNMLKLELLE